MKNIENIDNIINTCVNESDFEHQKTYFITKKIFFIWINRIKKHLAKKNKSISILLEQTDFIKLHICRPFWNQLCKNKDTSIESSSENFQQHLIDLNFKFEFEIDYAIEDDFNFAKVFCSNYLEIIKEIDEHSAFYGNSVKDSIDKNFDNEIYKNVMMQKNAKNFKIIIVCSILFMILFVCCILLFFKIIYMKYNKTKKSKKKSANAKKDFKNSENFYNEIVEYELIDQNKEEYAYINSYNYINDYYKKNNNDNSNIYNHNYYSIENIYEEILLFKKISLLEKFEKYNIKKSLLIKISPRGLIKRKVVRNKFVKKLKLMMSKMAEQRNIIKESKIYDYVYTERR